jgi:hypothetical protein
MNARRLDYARSWYFLSEVEVAADSSIPEWNNH